MNRTLSMNIGTMLEDVGGNPIDSCIFIERAADNGSPDLQDCRSNRTFIRNANMKKLSTRAFARALANFGKPFHTALQPAVSSLQPVHHV